MSPLIVLMAMYDEVRVYIDAAYNHPQGRSADDPRVHTVAAYFAEVDDWRKLRKRMATSVGGFRRALLSHERV